MDRSSSRRRFLLAALGLAIAVAPASGCTGLMTTIAYLVVGTDLPAEYDGLKGKKVAVVCRPMVSLQVRNSTVHKEIARAVSALLEQKVSKIQIVDQRKVDEWSDENTWDDYAEVGKALKADMVVGIDLEDFTVLEGQTLYQGKANVTVKVIDCAGKSKVPFERTLPQIVYPPNHGVPTSDRQESQFRREYVAYLADHIARHFYPHDPYNDWAQDAAALK